MNGNKEQLSVSWRYLGGKDALIWQLMFTPSGDIVGQKRFAARRQALFFSLDALSGRLLFDDYLMMDPVHSIPAGEGWFTGLETTLGTLFFSYIYQSQSPEHQGIWAIDARTGTLVWSRPDLVFAANLEDEFLVYRPSAFAGFPERTYLLIDPFTGKEKRSIGTDASAANAIRCLALPEEKRQGIVLPEFAAECSASERLALEVVGIAVSTPCECIVQGDLTVVALHEQGDGAEMWRSVLKVWKGDRLLYADVMEEGAARPCFNNFLIRSERLYYIKEKETLLSVAL